MAIEPDTKNWTWVLHERCEECGFDPAATTIDQVGARIRRATDAIAQRLADPGVAQRPDARTWSPLEYAAHVRDVCDTMLRRLRLLLTEVNPEFANWDQDQTALDDDYSSQRPTDVAAELGRAAAEFADEVDAVPAAALSRPGRRSDGSQFTVETLLIYAVHDLEHHAYDVRPRSSEL